MAKAGKKAEGADAQRRVLVGTYKGDQLTKWRGWYNYPIGAKDRITEAELFAGAGGLSIGLECAGQIHVPVD